MANKVQFYNRRVLFGSSGNVSMANYYDCCCNRIKRLYAHNAYPSDAPDPVQIDFEDFHCYYGWQDDDYLTDALSANVYDSFDDMMCPGFTTQIWYPSFNNASAGSFPNYRLSFARFDRIPLTNLDSKDITVGTDILDPSLGVFECEVNAYGNTGDYNTQGLPEYPRNLPFLRGYNFSISANMPVVYWYRFPDKIKQDDGTWRQYVTDDGSWLRIDETLVLSLPNTNIWAEAPTYVAPSHTLDWSYNGDDYLAQYLLIPKAVDEPIHIECLQYDYYPSEFHPFYGEEIKLFAPVGTAANWQDTIEFKVTDNS